MQKILFTSLELLQIALWILDALLFLVTCNQTRHPLQNQLTPLADPAERTLIEYSDRSLTVLWPRIITAKNGKKDIKSIAIMIL